MGIVGNAEITPISENLTDLLMAYRAMVDLRRSPKFDDTRYHRLENKVNALWSKLSNPEQRVACADLVKSDHMPQRYVDMLLFFDGQVNMNEPPEPCLKFGV